MNMTYTLSFNDYVSENSFHTLPHQAGILLIRLSERTSENKIVSRLLYIDKGIDINELVNNNHRVINKIRESIKKHSNKYITIAFALFHGVERDLDRIALTLIHSNKPRLNINNIDFQYDSTKVVAIGPRSSGLKKESIVERLN